MSIKLLLVYFEYVIDVSDILGGFAKVKAGVHKLTGEKVY